MQANDREKPVRTPWDRRKSAPSKNAWWLIASLMLLAFSVVPAHAQYSASLQGAVADAQGAMISGAQVTLTDTETNHSFTTTSSASGDFTFNELAPSTYTLVVTRNGFKKKVLDGIQILAEQANALNVVLDVGGTSETVTVDASQTPIIDTETGSISGTINQNDLGQDAGLRARSAATGSAGSWHVRRWFAERRRWHLQPPGNQGDSSVGASSGPYQTENKPQVFGNGGRNDTNGITIDGVQVDQRDLGLGRRGHAEPGHDQRDQSRHEPL